MVTHRTAIKPQDWLQYRRVREQRDQYLRCRHDKNPPEEFLVRADHFLRLCNDDFGLKYSEKITRRTLQFYSSPQAQLMPLPTYRDRHTAHYRFPDDYERLGVIWTLRSRFFMPIERIRWLLGQAKPELYAVIMDWDDSPQALMDLIAMEKAGFEPEDFDRYAASSRLLGQEVNRLLVRDQSPTATKKALLKKLDAEHGAARKWLASGRGMEFWSALIEARRARPDFDEAEGKDSCQA